MALYIQDLFSKIKQLFVKKEAAGTSGEGGLGQVFGPILGLLVFMGIAYYAIEQVRVNGPQYSQIKNFEDLRADVLPPPMYPVDAYANDTQTYFALLTSDQKLIEKTLKEHKIFEKNFKERSAYWDANNKEKVMSGLSGSYTAVEKSAENYFNVYNTKFLPAVQSGSLENSLAALQELDSAFRVSQQLAFTLAAQLEKSSNDLSNETNKRLQFFLIGLALLGLAIAFAIFYFGKKQADATAKAIKTLEEDGQNNQLAVLELLDEMGDLSDGDLTVRAQVKENITGAIADSINYTIDSLRDVVTEINKASEQVNTASSAAKGTSVALLEAAEMQSQQIAETTQAVNGMATSIQQVSSNANQAAQVAQRSLQAATQGSQAVQNTIAGMNGIREQIQETSKRIKRLGESSQEIGEIVELISDITEQTNILALNAAIQAASAGEAGRGFTVVAEEVQRLAERSSEATKQISAIVKTIQTDTNSAVAAMEKSTEGVVEGAKLSDAAGQALTEIETVTNNLARLIQSISAATEAQTQAAAKVTDNMQQIQEITTLTTQGTKQTTESVNQLTSLAENLRKSVAGFKL
jgi:twitching motility protein PilJ